MENRNGIAVQGCVTQATGRAEPQAASPNPSAMWVLPVPLDTATYYSVFTFNSHSLSVASAFR